MTGHQAGGQGPRRRGERGQERGLADRQLTRAAPEPVARRRRDAVDARPELDDVQVPSQDDLLGQHRLEPPGQDRLRQLARDRAVVAEEGVLHELLRDRRAAAGEPLLAQIDLEAAADLRQIEPGVIPEPRVLGGDEGPADVARQRRQVDPVADPGTDGRRGAVGEAVLGDRGQGVDVGGRRIGDHLTAVVEVDREVDAVAGGGVEIDRGAGGPGEAAADRQGAERADQRRGQGVEDAAAVGRGQRDRQLARSDRAGLGAQPALARQLDAGAGQGRALDLDAPRLEPRRQPHRAVERDVAARDRRVVEGGAGDRQLGVDQRGPTAGHGDLTAGPGVSQPERPEPTVEDGQGDAIAGRDHRRRPRGDRHRQRPRHASVVDGAGDPPRPVAPVAHRAHVGQLGGRAAGRDRQRPPDQRGALDRQRRQAKIGADPRDLAAHRHRPGAGGEASGPGHDPDAAAHRMQLDIAGPDLQPGDVDHQVAARDHDPAQAAPRASRSTATAPSAQAIEDAAPGRVAIGAGDRAQARARHSDLVGRQLAGGQRVEGDRGLDPLGGEQLADREVGHGDVAQEAGRDAADPGRDPGRARQRGLEFVVDAMLEVPRRRHRHADRGGRGHHREPLGAQPAPQRDRAGALGGGDLGPHQWGTAVAARRSSPSKPRWAIRRSPRGRCEGRAAA